MAISVGDVIRVTSRLNASSLADILNTWHFIVRIVTAQPTAAQVRTAFQDWLDDVFDSLVNHISSAIDPIDLKVDRLVWNGAMNRMDIAENLYFGPWTMASLPNAAGELLPTQLSGIVNLRTTRPQTVGRRFLPPFVEVDSTGGGAIAAAAIANMSLSAADMLLPITTVEFSCEPGVASQYSGADAHFWEFTSGSPNVRFCTQRRRRVGVGS